MVPVVEYYNASLGKFFVTSFANEIALLDSGTVVGWERTGFRFLAYTGPGAGRSPVCRYYVTPSAGSSHPPLLGEPADARGRAAVRI